MVMTVQYFKALADETRLRILNLLWQHELNVNEIMQVLQMGQSRISRHLKILSDSGILISRRDGLWIFYRVAENGAGREFVEAIAYLLARQSIFATDLQRCQHILQERTRETARFFDAIAKDWERMKHDLIGKLDLGSEISRRLYHCDVAVDLGCGTGDLLPFLKTKARQVIGVDNSPKMLEKARARFGGDPDGIEFRIGEVIHLPLGNGEADAVVINMVLHHLAAPEQAIAEIARVLRAGGQLLVSDFAKHCHDLLQTEYGDRWLGFTEAEMDKWLARSGFSINDIAEFAGNDNLVIRLYSTTKELIYDNNNHN